MDQYNQEVTMRKIDEDQRKLEEMQMRKDKMKRKQNELKKEQEAQRRALAEVFRRVWVIGSGSCKVLTAFLILTGDRTEETYVCKSFVIRFGAGSLFFF